MYPKVPTKFKILSNKGNKYGITARFLGIDYSHRGQPKTGLALKDLLIMNK